MKLSTTSKGTQNVESSLLIKKVFQTKGISLGSRNDHRYSVRTYVHTNRQFTESP